MDYETPSRESGVSFFCGIANIFLAIHGKSLPLQTDFIQNKAGPLPMTELLAE
jgi:hypothetical protein